MVRLNVVDFSLATYGLFTEVLLPKGLDAHGRIYTMVPCIAHHGEMCWGSQSVGEPWSF